MQCGPVRHRVNARAQAAARPFEHLVLVQPTTFQPARTPDADKRVEFQTLYQELVEDETRNRRICDDVIESVNNGRSPLVLTERNDHLDRLESADRGRRPSPRGPTIGAWARSSGRPSPSGWRPSLAKRHGSSWRPARYVGEGFDDPRLDTLFLTLPVSWRGTIAQYAGRLHRLYDSKREVRIYDYADLNVPMLARMFDRRCRGYEAVGYHDSPAGQRHSGLARRRRSSHRTHCGSATTPAACAGSCATASTCRSPACSSTPLVRCLRMPMVPIEREVRRKPFCIGAWKPWRRPRVVSASTCRCLSHSMVWEDWKSISYAPTHVSRWNSTARSISRIQSRIGATGARIKCCRRTAISCCASLPKTWARNWTRCSMPF